MTTKLWQAVRTSDSAQVKLVLQHLKQTHNEAATVDSVTPRHSSDPHLRVDERSPTTPHATVPAITDSVSSVKKSPRSEESIGSAPATPKSPDSGQSSTRGRLLATNTLWREVLNAVDDQGFTSLTWAVLLSQEEIMTVRIML